MESYSCISDSESESIQDNMHPIDRIQRKCMESGYASRVATEIYSLRDRIFESGEKSESEQYHIGKTFIDKPGDDWASIDTVHDMCFKTVRRWTVDADAWRGEYIEPENGWYSLEWDSDLLLFPEYGVQRIKDALQIILTADGKFYATLDMNMCGYDTSKHPGHVMCELEDAAAMAHEINTCFFLCLDPEDDYSILMDRVLNDLRREACMLENNLRYTNVLEVDH